MLGEIFGKLTVLEEVVSDVKGHRKYICSCSCGNTHVAIENNLKRNITTQCTICSRKQARETQTTVNTNQNKLLYSTFASMKWRCENDERYVSRGIKVCDRWLEPIKGFSNFLEDMGEKPKSNRRISIDRINNDLGYYKENCRWAGYGFQNHNKSKRCDAKTSKYIGVSFDEKGSKWVVQFYFDGNKTTQRFYTEEDAAIYYDDLYFKYYGDRPNKTTSRLVTPSERKSGGISFCSKTNKYRVRITVNKKRINLGFYETEQEAEEVLENYKLNN